MKKWMFILLACLLAMPTIEAQNSKTMQKEAKKEYKRMMKRMKDEGWKIYGSGRSDEMTLLTHLQKLNDPNDETQVIMGTCSQCKSKNVGNQRCMSSACVTYANEAGVQLKGRIAEDMNADANNADVEFDRFYAAYSSKVEKEIRGELVRSYGLIRENKNGTYEMEVYYLLSENKAAKARKRAFEQAAEESQAGQDYGEKIRKYVEEPVDVTGE